MRDVLYKAFLTSLLSNLLKLVGGGLVARGLVEDGMMQEVAVGLAITIVTTIWDFWHIYHRVLYQRWLVVLGLAMPPDSDVKPEDIEAEARTMVMEGRKP